MLSVIRKLVYGLFDLNLSQITFLYCSLYFLRIGEVQFAMLFGVMLTLSTILREVRELKKEIQSMRDAK